MRRVSLQKNLLFFRKRSKKEFESCPKAFYSKNHLRFSYKKFLLQGNKKARKNALLSEIIFFDFIGWRRRRDSNTRSLGFKPRKLPSLHRPCPVSCPVSPRTLQTWSAISLSSWHRTDADRRSLSCLVSSAPDVP